MAGIRKAVASTRFSADQGQKHEPVKTHVSLACRRGLSECLRKYPTTSVVRQLRPPVSQDHTEIPERLNGNALIRIPVAAKMALAMAGVAGAMGGSPSPVGGMSS